MFGKIGRRTEAMATSERLLRRGFLGRLSQVALGVAGVLVAWLVLSGEAGSTVPPGSCRYQCPDGSFHATNCGSTGSCDPSIQHAGMTCALHSSTCGYR